MTRSDPSMVSIPCWVFCPLRRTALFASSVVDGFQSRAGFSVHCDELLYSHHLSSTGFNPVLGFLSTATLPTTSRPASSASFNPVLGFLSTATDRAVMQFDDETGFQSRAGFSVHCDHRRPRRSRRPSRVSIPCWVFCPLRPDCGHTTSVGRTVSIPCWVFCPLRPRGTGGTPRPRCLVSIPCWVFCPLRRVHLTPKEPDQAVFQSRAGFSVHCDNGDLRVSNLRINNVSIPCWVFCPLRQLDSRLSHCSCLCFNPVLGFLSTATHCDESRSRGRRVRDRVSIPCWVFCPLRLPADSGVVL